jgi:anthranilate phosphoribosyltransferase
MSISHYLKQIGRGSKGASDLNRSDAQTLMSQVLTRAVTDLEIGAFCMAMRIKGETSDELAGFYDAVKPFLPALSFNQPVLLLPSYNGARKTHLMTPLFAKWMSELGYLVLIHGTHEDPDRIGSEQIFREMGWPIATAQDNLQSFLSLHKFAYCPLEVLSPELCHLLAVRKVIGVRNSGHILAKMINPVVSASYQVSNYTHPAYPVIIEEFFKIHQANVISMRGHEGEPVASPRRLPELSFQMNQYGSAWTSEARYDELPAEYHFAIDAASTHKLYDDILTGACPTPQTLVWQKEAFHQGFSSALSGALSTPQK